jgi:hypothetical protein
MGLTVLYVAFGIVALWLLGEVLLQYKARLRWRLLAFAGFLTVVLGVLLASRVVIALGALAFAVGQTYVTLSFRRGFSTGWAIGGRPGASRRRRDGRGETARGPALEVSGLEEDPGPAAGVPEFDAAGPYPGPGGDGPDEVHLPRPMPDDTNGYGIYHDSAHGATGGAGADYGSDYDPSYDPYRPGPDDGGREAPYDYGQEDRQYAAYSDPYIGGQQYGAGYDTPGSGPDVPSGYDPASFGGTSFDGYGPGDHPADPYLAQQVAMDTPPGGIWVPHQRADDHNPGEDPASYGQEQGYNEQQQYRY